MEGIPHRLGPERQTRAPRRLLALASDERLTQEMQRGNEAAFEVAYGRYATGMLALCRHILGSRDEAEEALQHSFAAAWADLQRPDRPAPVVLKPWLYAVARHRCLSMLRRRPPSTVELTEVSSTSGLSDDVGRRADLRALLADLRDLPEEQRTALVLTELAGLSHADIADVLGRQTSGVKSLVYQARTTLADWREAREAPCSEIREQLSLLRGGALRRRALRRHLQACPNCRTFRAELQAQRRGLAIILPVLPSLGLERGVLAAAGLGGATGGGAVSAIGGGAAAGVGAPAMVQIGSATMATVTVLGVLAVGPLRGEERDRGRGQRAPLSQAPAKDRGALGVSLMRSPTRRGAPRPGLRAGDRAARPPSGSPGSHPPYADPRPGTDRDPGTGPGRDSRPRTEPQTTGADPDMAGRGESSQPTEPGEASQPLTKEDKETRAKKEKANQEEEAKIAEAEEEAAKKATEAKQDAKANDQALKKMAKADREAVVKGANEQQKAEEKEKKAKARS